MVEDAKLTGRPELAVAVTVNGGVLSGSFGRALKEIVWLALVTWKLWFTGAAAV
jgi:hypothetical protein